MTTNTTKKNMHIDKSLDGKRKRTREKIYTEQVVVKLSKELLTVIDYVVSNYHFEGKRVYKGRSNFIRSSCINMLRLKLAEMGDERYRLF